MEWFRRFLDWFGRIPTWWREAPNSQKIVVTMVLASVLIATILLAVLSAPRYVLLLTTRTEADAGTIIQQLEALGIPYRVEAGNRILISSDYNVYEVRMRLASAGVLAGATRGFEILDQMPLGATSFDKQLRYQVALQGELERTISSLRGIQMARVVLTLPKYTYYVRGEMADPRASVMVVVEPGVNLSKEQIMGIVSLVQGAVEGLKAENVKVVDQTGRNLSDLLGLDQSTALASTRAELKMMLENYYRRKIKEPLESVFGPGRVEVIPDVKLNWEKLEKEIVTYTAPNKKEGLVRSKEVESELSTQRQEPGGPVGTESNIPPTTYETVEGTGQTLYQRSRQIVNYELNQTVERVMRNSDGEIQELTISILIDASSTVVERTSRDELQKLINSIVEKSIDANTQRESVAYAVAFVPFSREIEQRLEEQMRLARESERFRIMLTLLFLASVLIFFAVYLGLVQFRRLQARKVMLARYKALQEEAQRMIQQLKEEEVIPGAEDELLIEQLKGYLLQVADTTPEDVATVLKLWIAEKG